MHEDELCICALQIIDETFRQFFQTKIYFVFVWII
eukprot:UN19787